ncbi:hypothetical protein ACFX1X_022118 [Malus domestica]
MEQEPHIPISLHEYFSNDFFQQCITVACHMVEIEIEEPLKGKAIAIEEGKILTPKEGLPTHFSIEEVLQFPNEMRKALVTVLVSPDANKDEGLNLRPHEYATCCAAHDAINFTDKDLLLGSKPYNCSFFVFGYVREHKVNRMLVDNGAAINIMAKSTMTIINIKVDELSQSCLIIQGFNQGR